MFFSFLHISRNSLHGCEIQIVDTIDSRQYIHTGISIIINYDLFTEFVAQLEFPKIVFFLLYSGSEMYIAFGVKSVKSENGEEARTKVRRSSSERSNRRKVACSERPNALKGRLL